MEYQEIFAPSPQTSMAFVEPPQAGLQFPVSLAERYEPRRIEDFIGLAQPKALLAKLARRPMHCSLLFVGPPGTGKTAMAMAFADAIGGSLKHVQALRGCPESMGDAPTARLGGMISAPLHFLRGDERPAGNRDAESVNLRNQI